MDARVKAPLRRRTDCEPQQAGDYYDGHKRYYDQNLETTVVKLFSGDCYVTAEPELLITILGSCIAACVRDPVAGVAGMNHFLLPGTGEHDASQTGSAARYGAYAMESLINGLLRLGALRARLQVKLFGGGNVIDSSARIGSKNVAFAQEFLRKEGLLVQASDVGGDWPRRVHFFTGDGRVMLRTLRRQEDLRVLADERAYAVQLQEKPPEGEIELFG